MALRDTHTPRAQTRKCGHGAASFSCVRVSCVCVCEDGGSFMGIICLLFPVFFREVVCAPGGPEGVGEGGFGWGGGRWRGNVCVCLIASLSLSQSLY